MILILAYLEGLETLLACFKADFAGSFLSLEGGSMYF